MKLNLFTAYALRTLVYLVWNNGRTVTADEVSRFYGISHDHVVKVIQELGRRGYVHSRRGRGGGTVLASKPEDLTLAELITTFEGPVALLDCLRSSELPTDDHDCKLKDALHEGQRLMMAYWETVSLKDLAGENPPESLAVENETHASGGVAMHNGSAAHIHP